MNLSWALYLIDMLTDLEAFLTIVIIICALTLAIYLLFYGLSIGCSNEVKPNKKYVKTLIITILICGFIGTIIPSEKTMQQILVIETVTDERTIEGAKEVYEWIKNEIQTWTGAE